MRKTLSPLRIESLESRIAPSVASVTVAFSKGALTLTSDAGIHDFTLTALDATTTELHATGMFFHMDGVADSDTILLTGPLKTLTATLGDAADHLSLIGLNIGGDVTINGGAGVNSIDLNSLTIKGSLKITGGAGADTIHVMVGNSSVKSNFTLDLGDGTNATTSDALLQVGKDLTYTGGSGADGFTMTQGALGIGGNLSFTLGAGASTLGLGAIGGPATFAVGKKFTVDSTGSLAGDVVSILVGGYATKINGDISVRDGAGDLTFGTQSATLGFHGKAFVETGPGTASTIFTLYQLLAKSITIDASASSSSTFTTGGIGSNLTTSLTYLGGSGPDQVSFLTYGNGSGAGGASLNVNLGDGANMLNATSASGFFKTVKVTGGAGNDQITLTALGAKTGSVDVQTGGGTDTTQIGFIGSSVSGKISVANAADAVKSTVSTALIDSVVGSLDIALSGDGNMIQFGAGVLAATTNGATVKKAIHLVGGANADTVSFLGATNLKVAGGINIELGDGANSVLGPVVNLVTKSLSVTGGSGTDAVFLPVTTGNLGAVTLALGAGANSAIITGGAAPLALASLVYTSTGAAADADSLTLARLIVSGKLDAKFGAGASTFLVDDSTIGNTFNAETGAGADMVKIDTTDTYTGTVFTKAATLHLGDDDDTLVLGGNGTSELVTAKSTFTVDGGTGTNTLTDGPGNIYAKPLASTGF